MKDLWNNLKKLLWATCACVGIVFGGGGIFVIIRRIANRQYPLDEFSYTAAVMALLVVLCATSIILIADLVEQELLEKYDLRSKLPSPNRCTNCNCKGPEEVAGQEQGVCDRYRDSSD